MGREPPLTDYELRVIRGMIDEYQRERFVHQLLSGWVGFLTKTVAVVSAAAVIVAAIFEIIHTTTGG